MLATLQRHLERASGRPSSREEVFEAMLDHALEAWGSRRSLPAKYRVFARDGWRCTMPGCTGYRNLHDHHIVFRAAGARTSWPTARRCAGGITCGRFTRGWPAAWAGRRAGCALRWACDPASPRS